MITSNRRSQSKSGEKETRNQEICDLLLALPDGDMAFWNSFTSQDPNILMGLGQVVSRLLSTSEILLSSDRCNAYYV